MPAESAPLPSDCDAVAVPRLVGKSPARAPLLRARLAQTRLRGGDVAVRRRRALLQLHEQRIAERLPPARDLVVRGRVAAEPARERRAPRVRCSARRRLEVGPDEAAREGEARESD